jgi:hypothetical protein
METTLTQDTPADQETPAGSKRWMLLGAVVAAVVVVTVVLSLRSASEGSVVGAATSAEAVNGLAVALAAEDVVGAAAMLPPSEIGHAIDLYRRVIELAQKEGTLAGDDPLAGIDLQVVDLDIRVDALHERVHKVYLVDGTLGITVDPAQMDANFREAAEVVDESITLAEINELLAEEAAAYEPGGFLDARPPSELFVMVVHERGRWFVSPLYTSFEYVRTVLDLPPVDYEGSSVGLPSGTDTASGVLQQVVDQVNGFDLDAQLEAALAQIRTGVLMPSIDPTDPLQGMIPVAPDEMAVFLDHLPMFQAMFDMVNESVPDGMEMDTGEIADMVEELAAEMEPALDITLEIGTTEEVLDHERTKVVVSDAVLHVVGSVTLPEGAGAASADATLTIRGTCAVVDYLAELPGEQGPDRTTGLYEGCLEDAVPGLGVDGLFVVTRRIDGSWYLSPVETVVEYLAVVLDAALSGAFEDLDLGVEDILSAPVLAAEILSAPMEKMGGDDMAKGGMDLAMEPNDGYTQSSSSGATGTESAMPAIDPAVLAEDCRGGDPWSCDVLWDYSDPGSDDEKLASGCGDPADAISEGGGFAFGACAGDGDWDDGDRGGYDEEWGPYEECLEDGMSQDSRSSVAYTKAMRDCLPLLPEDSQAEMLRELESMEAMVPFNECMEGHISFDDEDWSQTAYVRGMRECVSLAPEDQRAEMEEWLVDMETMLPYDECMGEATGTDGEEWSQSAYLEGMKSCVELAPDDKRSWIEEEIASTEAWAAHEACMETEMGGPGWWNEEWTEEFQDRNDAAYAACADLEPEYGEVGILEEVPKADGYDGPTASEALCAANEQRVATALADMDRRPATPTDLADTMRAGGDYAAWLARELPVELQPNAAYLSAAAAEIANAFDGKDDFLAALPELAPLETLGSEYGFEDPGEAEYAIDDFFLVCGAGDNAVFKAFEEAMSVLDGAFEGDDEEPDGDDPYGEGGEPDVSVDSVMVEALDG